MFNDEIIAFAKKNPFSPLGCFEYANHLKPCPFCGGKAYMKQTSRWPRKRKFKGEYVDGHTVICVNIECPIYDADGQWWIDPQEAEKHWNMRAIDRVDQAPGFDQVRSVGRNGACIVCGAELTEGYGPACPECDK